MTKKRKRNKLKKIKAFRKLNSGLSIDEMNSLYNKIKLNKNRIKFY